MNHLCLTACHISLSGLGKKKVLGGWVGGWYVHKACEDPHERAVIPPFTLKGVFGSYDTFTYSPEQKSFPFISAHALRRISEIHLSVWSTVTWRRAAGPLSWAYLINWISCQLRQTALCIMSSFKCGEQFLGDYFLMLHLLECFLFWCIVMGNVCCMRRRAAVEKIRKNPYVLTTNLNIICMFD